MKDESHDDNMVIYIEKEITKIFYPESIIDEFKIF